MALIEVFNEQPYLWALFGTGWGEIEKLMKRITVLILGIQQIFLEKHS